MPTWARVYMGAHARTSEADDRLCWLLLEHIHLKMSQKRRLQKSDLHVLVQMPECFSDPDLNSYIDKISGLKHVTVFRDQDASNLKAVRDALSDALSV